MTKRVSVWRMITLLNRFPPDWSVQCLPTLNLAVFNGAGEQQGYINMLTQEYEPFKECDCASPERFFSDATLPLPPYGCPVHGVVRK